jgi:FSR family fosmidomycin resistance protein-like MFS transporter
VLGNLADTAGIDAVYHVCAFLPLIGLLTVFLPNIGRPKPPGGAAAATGVPAATPAE